MTSSRRITLALAAAAGGPLAAALLPVAVAFADDYSYVPDPDSPEVVIETSGISPLFSIVSGTQIFDVDDTTVVTSANPDVVSAFSSDDDVVQNLLGFYDQSIVVTSAVTTLPDGAIVPTTTYDPPDGTVFDNLTLFDGLSNALTIVPSSVAGGADTVSDTLVTPLGDIPILTDAAVNLPAELLAAF